MAESKSAKAQDAGQKTAQETYNEAAKQGFYGSVPPQPPNSAFSMESGPDSPSPLEQHIALQEGRVKDMHASTAKGAE